MTTYLIDYIECALQYSAAASFIKILMSIIIAYYTKKTIYRVYMRINIDM